MPLIRSSSKKALKKNIETEMLANPGEQNRAKNIAIAYSVKRQVDKRKKHKKMAEGGEVKEDKKEPLYKEDGGAFKGANVDQDKAKKVMKAFGYAEGGEVNPKLEQSMKSMKSTSIADAIRRKKKLMASGGEVDLQDNGVEHGNYLDELNMEAVDSEIYDLDGIEDVGSNEISPEHEQMNMDDMHMIDRIRLRMKQRNR